MLRQRRHAPLLLPSAPEAADRYRHQRHEAEKDERNEQRHRHMRTFAVERGSETVSEIGEHEGRRHHADRGCTNISEKPHAKQRRSEIDEPEREERHEAEEEQVAEALLLEAGAKLLHARAGAFG
jgi:hypothetical protein